MAGPHHGMESDALVRTLVENHRDFLAFLERRVGSRVVAEDLLQEAFARGVERAPAIDDGESAVAWFYRVLRNAIIDHHRRRASAGRAMDAFAKELEGAEVAPPDVHAAVCACVARLVRTLKPEYAEVLKRVEVEGVSVKDFSDEAGISANNGAVRAFRAREALRKQVVASCGTCAEHGCVDCTCGTKKT